MGYPLKTILHLSSYDQGGAGLAAYRLHVNLRAAGYRSVMAVGNRRQNDPDVHAVPAVAPSRLRVLAARARLKLMANQDYYFQDQSLGAVSSARAILNRVKVIPDAIVVHWVSHFVSAEVVREMSLLTGAPVIWYLLDMAPLTGGCHYAWTCDGYTRDCGMCPALSSLHAYDRSYRTLQAKRRALEGIDLRVVAGSEWLDRQARRSALFRDRAVTKILLSVAPDVFAPGSKTVARRELGLPEDRKIILFGNQGLTLKRKGMSLLLDALSIFNNESPALARNVTVAIAGTMAADYRLPFEYRGLGFLTTDADLARAYRAADVFVCPSIEDSGPMMINEAIMTGTPVVSFEMGVAPDLVESGVTGYLARLRDSADLAHGLSFVLSRASQEYEALALSCRNLGLCACHPDRQVAQFAAVLDMPPSQGVRA